uniref:Homing endonuclease LAGLIDADG domain-containing protein n=1 Tax=Chlamydomonas sphaeroides TaxID=28458 RepID=Q8WL04_9CHLO|nr:putative protein [Chlamydomonas sphaeroides]
MTTKQPKKRTQASFVRTLSPTEAAYLAGVIDSDGAIIAQIKQNVGGGYVMLHQLSVTLQVTQKTKRRVIFLQHIVDLIGEGNLRDRLAELEDDVDVTTLYENQLSEPPDGSKKVVPVSDFYITKRESIAAVLTQIKPYLVVKKEQAVLVEQIITALKDNQSTKDPALFIPICRLVDRVALLNDSKNKTTSTNTVIETLKVLPKFANIKWDTL